MRGPRSRAGLTANPVGPPSDKPIPNSSNATGNASNAPRLVCGETIIITPNTSTKVPTASVIILCIGLLMAGPVQNAANCEPWSVVSSKCWRYVIHTINAPSIAPNIWAIAYIGTSAHANLPAAARPILTAGFKCAPLDAATA